MPDSTIRLDNVSGQHIIFRNFRGRSTPVTREGDRSFCLVVFSSLLRDQLAARGCNIKKLNDGTEFVRVAVRITPAPEENTDNIWTMLDMGHIDQADLEFHFYEYNINGKKRTKIHLINADFRAKGCFINQYVTTDMYNIGFHYPNHITCTIDNKNNTEETKMEKVMSVEEILMQFALMEYAYKNANSTDKKNLEVIMKAVRAAKHYLTPKMVEDHCEIAENPDTKTKSTTEVVGDFAAIKQVIFNDPATIVVWWDDTKTVVKCQKGDNYSMENGLAMCIAKRMMGNKSNFNKQIRKYTDDVKNVQTKKKPKEGTFEERKAARMAQAEANKKTKGNSKNFRGKDIVPRKKGSPAIVNTDKMFVITEAYVECVRKKMAKRGYSYDSLAAATGLGTSTVNRYFSPNVVCQKPKRMKIENFKKVNKVLCIRWKIEE